jgi:NAD(P)-dependent dehydrogenase (short-subunit alcohol dehydrogenase family)
MPPYTTEQEVVLITAGANGIGRCMAETFLAQGYLVHVCDISSVAIEEFLLANPKASASLADVSCVEDVDKMFAELTQRYGRLDILINNAGVAGPTAALEDIDPEEWNHCINVDLNGPFYCTRKATPLLKKNGGSVINMSSNAALFGFPLRSAYSAAKWAMIGLTKTWAMELGPYQVRVNAICPCSVNGPRIENVINADAKERGVSSDEIRKLYQSQSSMRLFVDPEDIAAMALFLCSPAGAKISGQSIAVDGHTENLSTNF